MTTIKATCNDCGDVELSIDQVRVTIGKGNGLGSYSFRCPCCATIVVKNASGHTINLLITAGVSHAEWAHTTEFPTDRSAPLFTHDDLVEFRYLLTDDAAIAAALEGLHR